MEAEKQQEKMFLQLFFSVFHIFPDNEVFWSLQLWKEQNLLLILPQTDPIHWTSPTVASLAKKRREISWISGHTAKFTWNLQWKFFNFELFFLHRKDPRSSMWISFLMFSWIIANSWLCFFLFVLHFFPYGDDLCDTALNNKPPIRTWSFKPAIFQSRNSRRRWTMKYAATDSDAPILLCFSLSNLGIWLRDSLIYLTDTSIFTSKQIWFEHANFTFLRGVHNKNQTIFNKTKIFALWLITWSYF